MQVVLLWFESEQRQSPFVGAFEGLPGDVLLPFEAFEPPVAIIQKDAPALPVGLVDAARMPDSAVDEQRIPRFGIGGIFPFDGLTAVLAGRRVFPAAVAAGKGAGRAALVGHLIQIDNGVDRQRRGSRK